MKLDLRTWAPCLWLIAFGFFVGMLVSYPVEAETAVTLTCSGTASGTADGAVGYRGLQGDRMNVELEVRLRCY